MEAAIYLGPNTLTLEDVSPLDPGEHDVVVELAASGVCHSDLSASRGYLQLATPMVLGHEGAGRIRFVGDKVTRVKLGDRVICAYVPACGNCWWCLHDQSHLCARTEEYHSRQRWRRGDGSVATAFSGLGTFAPSITVDESAVVSVDTDISDDELALVGCALPTGVGAVINTAHVPVGSSVAIIGCGGVGQAAVQGAVLAGAAKIIAIDPQEMKRAVAVRLGATDTVDPASCEPVDRILELTAGRGVDFAFEIVGVPKLIEQAFRMVRKGGTVVVVGVTRWDAQVAFAALPLMLEEKRILGSYYGSSQVRRDLQRLLDLVARGRLDIGVLVSRRYALRELRDALHAIDSGEVIRSVIVF